MILSRKIAGDILPSLLSGLVGVVIGVIIVITVINPAVTPTPVAPERNSAASLGDEAPNQRSSIFGVGKSADTTNIPDAVAKVTPAVVTIDTTTMRRVYERGRLGLPAFSTRIMEIPQGMGTGVIVSSDGKIVTNNHVIQGAKTINVTLSDRRQFVAKLLDTDPMSDIAILKITDDQPFPVAELTPSEEVRIGEWVATIGNPLGVGQTVTVGVLSARGRHISDQSVELRDLLQTDAAINPGNSGGPLVNTKGQVIGINTAILTAAQGIGFAIPAESVTRTVESLNQNGRIVHPYLGIEMIDLTPAISRYLELSQDVRGVVVGRLLNGGPAQQAGINANDVIVSINDEPTATSFQLQSIVHSLAVGSTAKVKVIRDNQEVTIEVQLREMPRHPKSAGVNTAVKAASATK